MEDDLQREEILQVCFRLIDICDEVWIYGDSEGCRKEAEYARRAGKVVRMYGRDLERQKNESSKAYAAFCIYRDMGVERSIEKVYEKRSKRGPLSRLKNWSVKYNW